jgi:hypothetical protein
MSIKINKETLIQEKIEPLNLISIIEKYYLPKDASLSISKISKSQNLDTSLSDYLSLLSTSQKNSNKNINIKQVVTKKDKENKDISTIDGKNNNIKETNNIFSKIFRNYIVPYFTLKDLIALKHSNKMFNSIIDKKSINLCTLSNTLKPINSPELRIKIWYHYLNLKEFNKELFEKEKKKLNSEKEELIPDKIEELFYNKSLEIIKLLKNNDMETLLNIYEEKKISSMKISLDFIVRDVDRTFHSNFFESENGKQGMQRILEALCTIDQNEGYCQGMNFIIGGLYYLLRNEAKSFYIFNCILNSNLYQYNRLFADNTPDYHCRVHQINYYVKKYIPEVYYHFKKKDIPFDIIYSRWILTLFANYLNLDKLDFPWTCFFVDKWKGLIKICLIFIYELKDELIKRDMEGISVLIKNDIGRENKYHDNYNYSFKLYKDKFQVSNKQLRILKEEYYIILAKKKLELTKQNVDKWAEDQKEPLTEYLQQKEKIEQGSLKDIETYKNLIESDNQKYLLSLHRYNTLKNYIEILKKKIDELANNKYSFEELFSYFKKNINQILEKNNIKISYLELIETGKISELNQDDQNKIKILEDGKNKIMEQYIPIKDEYDKNNNLLIQCYEIVDKLKFEIEKWEFEKKKRREQMQDYLFIIEQKKDELIKILCEKLKLSDNFKKNNKF